MTQSLTFPHLLTFFICLQVFTFHEQPQIRISPNDEKKRKIVIVANRLPLKIVKNNEEYLFVPSAGGLATAINSIRINTINLCIGWPGLLIDDDESQINIARNLSSTNLIPVFLSKNEITNYYNGFCNQVLWPGLHSMTQFVQFETKYWQSYHRVNEKFAEMVVNISNNNSVIWIHDFHLFLLPKMIRERIPNITIGFFLHIPFPSFENFIQIPWYSELLTGMLGADVIGFHTSKDKNNFLHTASRVLQLKNNQSMHFNYCCVEENEEKKSYLVVDTRLVTVDKFPLGIDVTKFEEIVQEKKFIEYVKNLRTKFKGRKILLSVDRLDYIKGLTQKLKAFQLFLRSYSEYSEKVILYMLVVPSREEIQHHKKLFSQINELVNKINTNFSTKSWTPVLFFYESLPIKSLTALYNFADVCLITSLADGMNLVSKEFVASRNRFDGVLILSESAGASEELKGALIVNAKDINEISNTIFKALSMPLVDQFRRMFEMRNKLYENNITHWLTTFTNRLYQVKLGNKNILNHCSI